MAGEPVHTVSSRWPGFKNPYALIAYLLLFQAFTGLHPWRLIPKQYLGQYQQSVQTLTAPDAYFRPMAGKKGYRSLDYLYLCQQMTFIPSGNTAQPGGSQALPSCLQI